MFGALGVLWLSSLTSDLYRVKGTEIAFCI